MINFKFNNIQQLSIEFNKFKKSLLFFNNVFEKINYKKINIIVKKRVNIDVSANDKKKLYLLNKSLFRINSNIKCLKLNL